MHASRLGPEHRRRYADRVTSAWRGEEGGPRKADGTPDYEECERLTVEYYIGLHREHPEFHQRDGWVIEADGFPRRRTEDEKPLDQQIEEDRAWMRRDLNTRGGGPLVRATTEKD